MTILRRVFILSALIAAWALAGNDRTPVTFGIGASIAAAEPISAVPAELAEASDPIAARLDVDDGKPSRGQHNLAQLSMLTKVILYVKDNYVDPRRVKPKEMLVSALEYVEKSVPDVLVEGTADTGRVKLQASGKSREFDISHVDSLWKMTFTLKDIFAFLSANMHSVEDTREVEYAAINGMLSTLDPHSVLMRPELFREMKLTTKGEFGGLGFVIQMREGNLTVVKVLPKTPAARAQIKKDDLIKKIGDESTVNMELNEAVGKLRGPVDSKVTITIERKGWEAPKAMTVTRALISIESVQSKMLADNVGYVRLKNFQGNTTRHLQQALADLDAAAKEKGSAKGVKGLVLDLRGNPGGLLDQAIQVSDLFLSQGTIVATVGLSDKLREEKKAHSDDEDDAYPVVVLVNAGSASASEIVAGALKNLNRAVVIGRQTFGKGSVQVLYDNFPDDAALKLTIAKYLTPGDLSIQEVGITPDIQLIPTRVSKERVDLFAPRKTIGEADLDHHFGNPSNAAAAKKRDEVVVREKPIETLKYLKDEPKKVEPAKKDEKSAAKDKKAKTDETENEELDDQLDAESQDEIKEDFEVLFARDYLLAAPFLRRDKMLESGKGFVNEKRKGEEERIAGALTALGVDWTPGDPARQAQVVGTLKPTSDLKIFAGESVQLELTAENRGTEPVRRLRAWSESDNGWLDKREFVFGMLKPGEKKSWSVQVKLPKDMTSRRDGVTVKFQDDHGVLPDGVHSELNFVELPRPAFSFNYQVLDECQQCNSDGQVQRGEELTLLVDITNTGTGKALDTFASIKNASGDQNVFIEKGRWKLGEIPQGETRTARFQLQVKKGYKTEDFALRIAVIDEPLEEFTTEKMVIPVAKDDAPPVALEARRGVVRVAERADVFASADQNARVIAKLPKGAVLNELARGSQVARVEFEKDRFAFIRTAELKDGKGQKAVLAKDVDRVHLRSPPQITLSVDPQSGGTVVDQDRFTLSAVITDPKLLDVYVLVNDQKVFFKGKGPDDDGRMKITTEFSLKEGNNYVTVVARESSDFAGRKTVVVRRRPAAFASKTEGKPAAPARP
jgi:carboxyl-terminal processing protease